MNPADKTGFSASFRLAQKADMPAVIDNELSTYAMPWSKQSIIDSLDSQYWFYVMDYQSQVIGHLILHPIVDECHLLNICVIPAYQGHGLGRRAMEFWFDLARQQAQKLLILEVRESNLRAITLYRTLGFEVSGVRKNYYPLPNCSRENGLVMCFNLS